MIAWQRVGRWFVWVATFAVPLAIVVVLLLPGRLDLGPPPFRTWRGRGSDFSRLTLWDSHRARITLVRRRTETDVSAFGTWVSADGDQIHLTFPNAIDFLPKELVVTLNGCTASFDINGNSWNLDLAQ